MRKALYIAIALVIIGCKTGYIEKKIKKNLFNKFDYENWGNEKYKEGIGRSSYIYKRIEYRPDTDGNNGFCIYIEPQKKQFYTIYNQYYGSNFNLKERGKFFGDGQGVAGEGHIEELKIGIWDEYDEKGNLIKQTDEDKKFGKFGYNELLKFLDKEKKISLKNGVIRGKSGKPLFYTHFYYSDISDKKLWFVIIYKSDEEPSKDGYYIDGNTGRVLKNTPKEFNYYKEIRDPF
ncbi:hypothetical protein SL053_002332 [Flavobacterium psychrophilum]|nr:hypothetical protein [Flavobacterium psychrophilum]